MKRLTDPTFRYVPAARTDISKTFARIRREQKQAEQERAVKIMPMKREKR